MPIEKKPYDILSIATTYFTLARIWTISFSLIRSHLEIKVMWRRSIIYQENHYKQERQYAGLAHALDQQFLNAVVRTDT